MLKPFLARQTVCVDDIRIEAFIGVHGHEKHRRQSLIVAVELELDPPMADTLASTIDYNRIAEACRELADQGISLIEVFASRLAYMLVADQRVQRASISITKPGALPNGIARATAELIRQTTEAMPQPCPSISRPAAMNASASASAEGRALSRLT